MRNMYQSTLGRRLIHKGFAQKLLADETYRMGAYADKPESTREIPHYLQRFKGAIKMEEYEKKVDEFTSLNDFFARWAGCAHGG